ncbi:MAG: TIGR02281 family clan AA aspartic protease [Hyphomicrobiaceae bacterium]|nr:TIGR02281 family clan AA aspartic protease [Hyphomicrobiaceae bacterium]
MRDSDGDDSSLLLDLATWLCGAAAVIALFMNYDLIRANLSTLMIAGLERAMPIEPADKRQLALKPSLAEPEPDKPARRGTLVELRADRSGHYQAEIEINGRRVDALVDTGATLVALTYEDAQRLGIYLRDGDFTMVTNTANGTARAAPITLDRVEIGPIQIRNVQASVSEPGRMRTNLLGMSFLSRVTKFESGAGRLVIHD